MKKYLCIFDIEPDRYIIYSNGDIYDTKNNSFVNFIFYNGYKTCRLNTIDNNTKSYFIHILVANAFYLCRPVECNIVNHIDLNKVNNDITNLEFVTASENVRHAIRNQARKLVDGYVEPLYDGTSNRCGLNNNNNKVLNESQVKKICELMENNLTYPEILESIGLEPTKNLLDILTKIRSKKLWVCVSKDYNIPNKEFRSPAKKYDHKQIDRICYLISIDCSISDIAKDLNVDISDYKEYDKFAHLIKRIKDKKTYINISNKYF